MRGLYATSVPMPRVKQAPLEVGPSRSGEYLADVMDACVRLFGISRCLDRISYETITFSHLVLL